MLGAIFSRIKQQKKIGLFVLFFLPILIKLGFWQLSRAEEKQDILAVYQEQAQLPVISLNALPPETTLYYGDVSLSGEYDPSRYWLLDNQPRNGRPGYEIIMPFNSGSGWVLVNRGWLLADQNRTQLPVIDTPTGTVELIGSLAPPQKNNIIDNNASDLAVEWPKRVLQMNIETAQANINETLLPTIFRIKSESPGAYTTDWPVVTTQAEKHQGYAVQWFAMALALITLYGFALSARPKTHDKNINK